MINLSNGNVRYGRPKGKGKRDNKISVRVFNFSERKILVFYIVNLKFFKFLMATYLFILFDER